MANYTSYSQSPTLGTLQTVSATPTSTLTSNPLTPTPINNGAPTQPVIQPGQPMSSQTQSTPMVPTQAPTTVTSGLAESDLATKKQVLADIKAGMSAQQVKAEAAKLNPADTDTAGIQAIIDEMASREAVGTDNDIINKENADNAAALKTAQAETDRINTDIKTQLDQFLSGTHPLTPSQQAQVDSLKAQFQSLINEQKITNQNFEKGTELLGFRTGQSSYMPAVAAGNIQSAINLGLSKIADLNSKMSSAVAEMEQGFQDDNFDKVTRSYEIYNSIQKQKTDAIQKTIDDAKVAVKEVKEHNDKVKKDFYDQVTKPIQDVAASAAQNGADKATMNAINSATTVDEAMAAAGDYLQTATGDAGDYLFYQKQTQKNGLTPLTFQAWQDKKIADKLKQSSSEAYANAYASASGKAAADRAAGLTDANEEPIDPDSNSILSQTGLSMLAFKFLSTGTSALTRLTSGERQKVMKEAQDWANKQGIDVATFTSQYNAYNKTLENNIKRVNQVKVAEGELKGTLENLKSAGDDSTFGNMKWANIAKMFAGQEFNDPNVSRYAFHLQQLRSEMAMYNAAAAGKIGADGQVMTDDGDFKEAERIIKDGFAAKSIQGFDEALNASVGKMDAVLNNSVNTSRKQVWNLFGVGDNFKPQASEAEVADAKRIINNYVSTTPQQADQVGILYNVPGATDDSVLDYMREHPEMFQYQYLK